MNHQFILGENQEPLFAVIPYSEYKRVFAPKEQAVQESEQPKQIPLSIRLPNGGPDAAIDLPRFVDYWCRKGILSMPINQRAKPFKDFESRERFSVEAMVRMCFVPASYRNMNSENVAYIDLQLDEYIKGLPLSIAWQKGNEDVYLRDMLKLLTDHKSELTGKL